MSLFTPNIGTFASTNATNGLFGNTTFKAFGQAAGMAANFWVMNPDVASASLRTAEGFQRYHTIQLLLNHRLTKGLSFAANYSYQVQFGSSLDTLFRDRSVLRTTNAPPHALKVLTNYELPFGRGQRFGADMNPWLDGIVGHWQVNLTGRVETGRLIDIGDVKLVNLSLADLQHEFKYYTNQVDGFVYNLPQDLIANTIKAFAIDVTSPTGYPVCTGANAATCGGPDSVKPYLAPSSDANCTTVITGDCNVRQQLLKAQPFSRFDLSVKKRFPFAHRASFDFEVDMLNVFKAIDYNSVLPRSTQQRVAVRDLRQRGHLSRHHRVCRHQQHVRSGRPHRHARVPRQLVTNEADVKIRFAAATTLVAALALLPAPVLAQAASSTSPAKAAPVSGGDDHGDYEVGINLFNRILNRGVTTTYKPGFYAGASAPHHPCDQRDG